MRTLLVVTAVLFALVGGNASRAATIGKVESKDGKTRLNLDGEIVAGDADKVREIIKAANDAGRVVATIRLNSVGGNLAEAVRLADIVRYAKTATAVLSGATCASACFVVFAAGSEKYAHYSAQLGVHGASDKDGNETPGSSAATISMAKVTKELGVPPGIIGKMVVTPPTQMVWLTVDDLRSMGASLIGKPSQTAPAQSAQSQLRPDGVQKLPPAEMPQSILPGASGNGNSDPGLGTSWSKITSSAVAISKSQNNGQAKFIRSCQPEYKVCTTGVYFKGKDGNQILVKKTEDMSGQTKSREVCFFNDFNDIRTCIDWDTSKKHRDMKNNDGKWYDVGDD